MNVTVQLRPNQDDLFKRLGAFIRNALPGVPFAQGEINRVPEIKEADFVIAWPLRLSRLATNLSDYADYTFVGLIEDDVLTVLSFDDVFLYPGAEIFGPGVAPDTRVVTKTRDFNPGALLNGSPLDQFQLNQSALLAEYTITPSQNVGPILMSAGRQTITQVAEAVVQLDVHGPNSLANAQTISTLFRDEYAVDFFAAFGDDVSPFHADDPMQVPFHNDQKQYEFRYVVEAHLQLNQSLAISQQFADAVVVTLRNAAALPVD